MIIDIWKPLIKTGKTIGYEIFDTESAIKLKRRGYVVRYTCDKCKSSKIQTTNTSTFFRSSVVYNKLEFQTCRACRSRISEYEIKKTQISFDIVFKSMEGNKYRLLSSKQEYDSSDNKSQMKLNCLCENNHVYKCTWNNWSKGKRCRECYNINRYKNSVSSKDGWELYHLLVWKHTTKNYKYYFNIINPFNLKRGQLGSDYNVDHKFSVSEGFKNNIPPRIIGSVHNLEMINKKENSSKGTKCSIEIDKLFELYFSHF